MVGTTTIEVAVTSDDATDVAWLNRLEAKDERAEESAVGRTTTGTVVKVVSKLVVMVASVGTGDPVTLPVADTVTVELASVVSDSTVVVVVDSTAVTEVSVTVRVVDGSGNAGRVIVVVMPSEMVTTTD